MYTVGYSLSLGALLLALGILITFRYDTYEECRGERGGGRNRWGGGKGWKVGRMREGKEMSKGKEGTMPACYKRLEIVRKK